LAFKSLKTTPETIVQGRVEGGVTVGDAEGTVVERMGVTVITGVPVITAVAVSVDVSVTVPVAGVAVAVAAPWEGMAINAQAKQVRRPANAAPRPSIIFMPGLLGKRSANPCCAGIIFIYLAQTIPGLS
jgi:hypothetical protein